MNFRLQLKRDSYGIMDLDNLDISDITYIRFGNYKNFSFVFEGEKFFFKTCNGLMNIYNELLAEVIAEKYGVNCVHYDLGSFNGMIGVVSKNFVAENDSFYHLSSFIDDFHNNVEDIIQVLKYHYHDMNIINNLRSQLINILVFDILIANHDRHTDNLGIIESDMGVNFCPLFDNELMLDYRSIFYGEYSLDIDNDILTKNLITKLIVSDCTVYKDKVVDNLKLISPESILDSLNIVENRIQSYINPYIKKSILDSFNSNYIELNKGLSENKKFVKTMSN